MKRIHDTADGAVVLCSSATALPNPPAQWAVVPDGWKSGQRVVPEFDLDVWVTDADTEVTSAKLIGAILHDVVLSDDDVNTVDFANNELDLTSHAYQSLDGPVRLTTTGTLPTGLSLATDYWVTKVNANSIQLSASLDDALAGTFVAFTDVGTGTHTISDTAATKRASWHTLGWLGDSADGAFSLTLAGKAYSTRAKHRAQVIAYAIEGTLDATNDIQATITAVEES